MSEELLHIEDVDDLLQCLVFLTEHFGDSRSADAITADLPFDEKGMGPKLFCEAAEKLHIKSKITKRSKISDISQHVLPAVIILNDNKACVLLAYNNKKAKIYSPDSDAVAEISLAKLTKSYANYAIFVHPETAFKGKDVHKQESYKGHWFWSLINENKALYGSVLVASLMINLFALTSPIFIMTVYDRVIPNEAIETGWALAIGALVVFGFDFIMRTLRGYFVDLAGRRIDVIAARRIYDQLLNMKLVHRPPSSGAFANMLRDFDAVRDFLTSATIAGLVDLPFTLLFLFVIYLLGGGIALVLAGLMMIALIVGALLQVPLKGLVRKAIKSSEAKHGILIETISGLETIKAIRADRRMRARYGDYVAENAAYGQKSRFVSAIGVNIATLVQQSASVIVVLVGMYLVKENELSMGALIACVILGGRAIAPVGQIAGLVTRYHQFSSSLRTLNKIMKCPVERPEGASFLNRSDLKGKIDFKDVSFSYPQTTVKSLDGVTFTINPGEKVGLIGRVGSGKSTISRLIMGLYQPDDGSVMADDTDYRQIDPADLRSHIAYISQDVVLFNGSIKDNITAGHPQATEEEILHASKTAGVHDFVARHPHGYDLQVGERGENLSGGQRQAVALARAMLAGPKVMVCDEPTNAMDIQAEMLFKHHIKQELGDDKTLILITHRPSLLDLVDRLIIVDLGKIVMDGPRDKVLEALNSGQIKVQKTDADEKLQAKGIKS